MNLNELTEPVNWDPDLVPDTLARDFNRLITDSLGVQSSVIDIHTEWSCVYDTNQVARPLLCCDYDETGLAGMFWRYDSTDGTRFYFDGLMRVVAFGGDVLFKYYYDMVDSLHSLHNPYRETKITHSALLYASLTPGTWTLRVGVPQGGGNNAYNFEMMEIYDEVTLIVEPYPPPPPPTEQATVTLIDSADWYDWLPEAGDNLNEAGNAVTLKFKVQSDDPEQGYFLRFRLHSSQYPGAWTNDYRVWVDSSDSPPQLPQSPPNANWVTALNPSKADLKIESTPTNSSWNIDFIIENWVEPESYETGYFSAYYDQLVYDDDEVEIEITSYDMGGRSNLMVDITPRPGDDPVPPNPHTMEFEHNLIYKRTRWPRVLWYQLPIPRDEDPYLSKRMYKGNEIITYCYGDGLGDPWEEQFESGVVSITGPRMVSSPDDKMIYSDIKLLRPEKDDSYAYSSFIPDYSSIDYPIYRNIGEYYTVKRIGDGINNFKKYRGINGITNKSLTTINYERLDANYRNIFVIPFELRTTVENELAIGGDYGVFNTVPGFHLLIPPAYFDFGDDNNVYDYVIHRGIKDTTGNYHYISDLDGVFPYGSFQLDRVFSYPDISNPDSVYAYHITNAYDFPVNAYIYGIGNEFDGAYGETTFTKNLYQMPYNMRYSHIDAYEIQDTLYFAVNDTSELYYSVEDIKNITLMGIKHTGSHELGHWLGMTENNCWNNNIYDYNTLSVMKQGLIDTSKSYIYMPYDYQYIQIADPPLYTPQDHFIWFLENEVNCPEE